MLRTFLAALAAIAVGASSASAVQSLELDTTQYDGTANPSVTSNLKLVVYDGKYTGANGAAFDEDAFADALSPGWITFVFGWADTASAGPKITTIGFGDGDLFGVAGSNLTYQLIGSTTVSYGPMTEGAPNNNVANDFPGGLGVSQFAATNPDTGSSGSTIDAPGDWLAISFKFLDTSFTFQDVVDALNNVGAASDDPQLQIRIRVQSLPIGEGSGRWVNTAPGAEPAEPVVPEPSTIFAALLGLIPVGLYRMRRRRLAA